MKNVTSARKLLGTIAHNKIIHEYREFYGKPPKNKDEKRGSYCPWRSRSQPLSLDEHPFLLDLFEYDRYKKTRGNTLSSRNGF